MVQPKRPVSALDADASLGNGQNWKRRKQERAHNARFIHAEANKPSFSSRAFSSTASSSGSSPVGSSKYGVQTADFTLPSSLEVEAVVSSRAFQIQSFLRSIKSAKSATTTRAWQLLPRHARRRAASHNLLRLPSRLRGKALAELKSSTTQARTRSETRKRMPDHGVIRATLRRHRLARRASHSKRRWLETHLWHAKRFRTTTEKGKGKEKAQGSEYGRWGFVLPETPMMKSHKASWRSALEHVTVHDASYHSIFRLGVLRPKTTAGQEDLRLELLRLLCSSGFGPVDLFTSSQRTQLVFDTVLRSDSTSSKIHDDGDCVSGSRSSSAALAPVRLILLPQTQLFRQVHDEGEFSCQEALIFVHPAGRLYVRRALKTFGCILVDEERSAALSLSALIRTRAQAYAYELSSAPDPWIAAGGKDSTQSKRTKRKQRQAFAAGNTEQGKGTERKSLNDEMSPVVDLDDATDLCRKQGYNIFEIVGPRASILLKSVLKLDEHNNTEAARAAYHQLLLEPEKRESISVPQQNATMVALEVHDPRLSYPPRFNHVSSSSSATSTEKFSSLANSRLLSVGASGPRLSQGEINSRRAKARVPGSRLQPDPRDDVVPIVLIKKRLVNKPAVYAFTLLAPRGWGTAFFMSLIATHQSGASFGARVIGQHQLRHQKLELSSLVASHPVGEFATADALSYPFNWPGTLAYAQSDKEAFSARLKMWAMRPRGKRTEFHWSTAFNWTATLKQHNHAQLQAQRSILSMDRVGAARPFPFGGPGTFEWIAINSRDLFGPSPDAQYSPPGHAWLLASSKLDTQTLSSIELSLTSSALASALVPLRLQAVRKGTISSQSSLMLAPTYSDHLSWVHHLDATHHPSLVTNRSSNKKMDKKHLKTLIERRLVIMQLGQSAPKTAPSSLETQFAYRRKQTTSDIWTQYLETAPDPESLHNSSADWNHTIGLVLDGDYSLGNGSGFGIGTVTMRAWKELLDRQAKLETEHPPDRAGRMPRNPVTTTHLILVREPGTDVLRAVTASFIPL